MYSWKTWCFLPESVLGLLIPFVMERGRFFSHLGVIFSTSGPPLDFHCFLPESALGLLIPFVMKRSHFFKAVFVPFFRPPDHPWAFRPEPGRAREDIEPRQNQAASPLSQYLFRQTPTDFAFFHTICGRQHSGIVLHGCRRHSVTNSFKNTAA